MRKVTFIIAIALTGVVVWLGLQDGSPGRRDRAATAAVSVPRIDTAAVTDRRVDLTTASLAERTGSTFRILPLDLYQSPRIRVIEVPDFPDANAIWGATGRDRRGHVWFGVSATGGNYSAHLFEYDPVRDRMIDRGDVISNLKAAGLYKDGERQVKIHSRIVQADDGYLYFSSTDEEGERPDGSAPPKWGSHLWRLLPGDNRWEHLHWVQEGLIAVAGGGRWVYALGLWDHVLYQYDTRTGALKSVTVGSIGGHMSRNVIADLRGHVFVPRVRGQEVTLVEFDSDRREIGATPLRHYFRDAKPNAAHGITGVVYLADGSMAMLINRGYLYRITPQDNGPSFVDDLGPFDPKEPNYAPSLFTLAGERFLVGVARKRREGKGDNRRYVWLVYDLETGQSRRVDSPLDGKALLYGSITRDLAGRFNVAGRCANPESGRPQLLILQLDTGE